MGFIGYIWVCTKCGKRVTQYQKDSYPISSPCQMGGSCVWVFTGQTIED